MSRQVLIPDETHPITVTPAPGRVVVRYGDHVVADTTRALALQESTYPQALYVPLDDVDPATVRKTDSETWCPYKGVASYWTLVGPPESADAVWGYEHPHDAVAPIAGHVAFYPDRVTVSDS